jgi:hypothetical protein
MVLPVRPHLENLAQNPPRLTLSRHHVQEVAHLALLIAQTEFRKAPPPGLVLSDLKLWHERDEGERNALTMHVARVLQALVLLGIIELPS